MTYNRLDRLWTAEENKILIENYPTKSAEEMELLLPGRIKRGIVSRANSIGIFKVEGYRRKNKAKNRTFSDEEIERLKLVYANTPIKELLKMFPGRARKQITCKAFQLGVPKVVKSSGGKDGIGFTKEEEGILRRYYAIKTNRELSEMIPRFNVKGISAKAAKMGLKKPLQKKPSVRPKAKQLRVDKPEKPPVKVFENKPIDKSNPVRVNANTIIYAKPGRSASEVIADYNKQREIARFKLLKADSRWS